MAAKELPSAFGPHWEHIGFQGLDPRTDVNRSMKMLAVLQVLHLLDTHYVWAKRWHTLSDSYRTTASTVPVDSMKDKSWPFFCVSIMFTKEAIQALRSGALNAKINKRKAILPVLHDFHEACFIEFARYVIDAHIPRED